jgi:diguanylate cyclase (GGDEF)-like protein
MRNNRPSAALYELLEEIGGAASLEQALAVVDRRLRRLLPFEAMAVFLLRDSRLALAYISGQESGAAFEPDTPVGQTIAGQVAQTRHPAFNLDPGREAGAKGPFRSMLAVPLDDGAELAGVLALYSADAGVFVPADLGVLLWIREDLTRAVKHALGPACPDPAACDPLTGLPNERGLFRRLDALLLDCRRSRETLAVLLCAVDGLTEVRARYGEAALGRLVQTIGAGLRRTCRREDCVARLGDEFALALEGFPAAAFDAKRTSMAALVEGIGLAHFGERRLSIRAGAAWFPDDAHDAEGLLAAAAARQKLSASAPDRLAEELEIFSAALNDAGAARRCATRK